MININETKHIITITSTTTFMLEAVNLNDWNLITGYSDIDLKMIEFKQLLYESIVILPL